MKPAWKCEILQWLLEAYSKSMASKSLKMLYVKMLDISPKTNISSVWYIKGL